MSDFIFIIPAGGVASRLRPFQYPKELLPVVFAKADDETGNFRPVVAIECTLAAMAAAGALLLSLAAPSETAQAQQKSY